MGSGPSNPEPRVLQALATPPIAPDDPAFGALLDDVSAWAERSFRRRTPARWLWQAHPARASKRCLRAPSSPAIRYSSGCMGTLGSCCAHWPHATAQRSIVSRPEWGTAVNPDDMLARVRQRPPKLVALVHADTSTGILQPLEAIGRACRDTGSLFVVDAVLSLGGCELAVDAWQVDAAIGGLQKCLGGPPGLAPVTYS